jgi:hypothetical protein
MTAKAATAEMTGSHSWLWRIRGRPDAFSDDFSLARTLAGSFSNSSETMAAHPGQGMEASPGVIANLQTLDRSLAMISQFGRRAEHHMLVKNATSLGHFTIK